MSVLVKAVYKQGMFQPVEPIGNLAENQSVQLQIWPDIPQEEVPEEDAWVDTEFEEEWAKLSPWEQQGLRRAGDRRKEGGPLSLGVILEEQANGFTYTRQNNHAQDNASEKRGTHLSS